ncbi:MAG TPA: hypothetical protein VGQ83_18480 [Polyangia bacterium]|jgi:hypothetical protein
MRSLLATAAAAALVGTLAGCPAPLHPYGVPDVDFRSVAPSSPPAAPRPQPVSPQPLVLTLWTNEATNPVGGLYDWTSYNVSPLYRTYYHPDIAVPLWEGAFDQLRGLGYRAYKDYSDTGNPALVKGPAQKLGALLLTGRVLRAVHDQVKETDAAPGFEAAYVEVDLVLATLTGEVLWRGTKTAQLKVNFDFGADLLDALGRVLGETLHQDPQFQAALAARGGQKRAVRP